MPSPCFLRAAAAVAACLLCVLPAAGEPLSLDRLVAGALRSDPETAALREELEVRRSGTERARTLPNPVVDAEIATGALGGNSGDARYSLGITQEIPLWGKRGDRLRAAEAEVLEGEALLAARERVVTAETRRLFLALLLTRERRQLAEDAAQLSKGLLKVAEDRFAEGDIPEYELNMARAEESAAENRRRENLREEAAAKRELLLHAGLAEDAVLPDSLAPPSPPAEAEAVSAALRQRPDALAARAETERADAALSLARREYLPDVAAGVVVERETGAEKDASTLVGIRFSLPIPVFDRNTAGIRAAAARASGAEERKRLLQQRIEREVKGAYRELQDASAGLSYFEEKVLPPMRENAAVVQEAYRLGETGIASVIQEQRKLLEALEARHFLLKEMREAQLKLETAAALPMQGGAQ